METTPDKITAGICSNAECDQQCGYCERIAKETDINLLAKESEVLHSYLEKYKPKVGSNFQNKLESLDQRIFELVQKMNG